MFMDGGELRKGPFIVLLPDVPWSGGALKNIVQFLHSLCHAKLRTHAILD